MPAEETKASSEQREDSAQSTVQNKNHTRRFCTIKSPDDAKHAVHDTELVSAIKTTRTQPSHQHDMAELVSNADTLEGHGLSAYQDELRSRLCDAVFVGHINTDLDSVAGAIGAAALFGGKAALAEPINELNGEILFALRNCGIEPPLYFEDMPGSQSFHVCLVDHTEEKQMVPALRNCPKRAERIVGVIDHHAIASSFQTSRPIFMDCRPWGSMSTIVGCLFVSYRKGLSKPLAVLLLQAILSDTLNLRSVTTTHADRSMVALLHEYGGIGNAVFTTGTPTTTKQLYEDAAIDLLAKKQFQAKTNWIVGLGPYEMVRGDQKDFSCGPWKFGISVLEVTDTEAVMKCAEGILLELRLLKKEKGLCSIEEGDAESESLEGSTTSLRLLRTMELDFAFLFVVNVVEQSSVLLICGGRELALAKAAFLENKDINPDGNTVRLRAALSGIHAPGSTIRPEETAMDLPKGYVSRKAQFVPAFFEALQDDFQYEEKGPMSEAAEEDNEISEVRTAEVQEMLNISKSKQRSKRRQSSLMKSLNSRAMEVALSRERFCDEELIKANEIGLKDRNGNLYDENGRVIRLYDY